MLKNRQILVMTHEEDAHLEYVERHLHAPLIRIDTSKVPEMTELSFYPTWSKARFGKVDLFNVGAVWYRKPIHVKDFNLPVKDAYLEYTRMSLGRHIDALKTFFPDAFWLPDYYAMLKAENKAWQLQLAVTHGFSVPDTVITSSVETAKAFIQKHGEVIVKPLSSLVPKVAEFNILPALKFSTADLASIKGLHLAPSIFQQSIKPKGDVRVTVVGEAVFAAIIKDEGVKSAAQIRDWRIGQLAGKLKFYPYELSERMQQLCISYIKRMGLQYGALDFVLDDDDTLWFLENNANGQWAFIEDDTGQPIGKAIATLLEQGARS